MKRNKIILFLVSVLILSILLEMEMPEIVRAEGNLAHLHRQKRKQNKPHQDWQPYGWSLEARTRHACIPSITIVYPMGYTTGGEYFVHWKYQTSPP